MSGWDMLTALTCPRIRGGDPMARALDVSRPAVVQAMGKTHPYADSLARYLEATGYILWAVPESLHLDAITDDAVRIDAAAGPSK